MERKYFEINERMAKSAHQMMSMRDYPEGSKTAEYRRYADRAYDLAEQIERERPKQAERAWQIATAYAHRMADNLNTASRIGCMCPSVLISGAGNFPVKKKEKQNAASDRNYREFNEIQKYLSKLESILHGKEVIRSDDEDAIVLLEEKLSKLESEQETMKAVNTYYRKNGTLDGCLELSEKERRKIESAWAHGWYQGIPYPAYALSNNNANLRRIRQRLESLKKEKGRETSEITLENLGITIKENIEDMRIQIFFEEKPEPEIREILKSRAFKWSPSNGCWQRQLSDNARYATNQIITELKSVLSND